MARIRLSLAARADLRSIWHHIADDNPDAADRLLRRLRDRLTTLAEHPLMGPPRSDIAAGVRVLLVGPYLVLYRAEGKDVEVTRVLHGARLPPASP